MTQLVVLALRELLPHVAVAQLPQLELVELVDEAADQFRRRVFRGTHAVLPQLGEHVVSVRVRPDDQPPTAPFTAASVASSRRICRGRSSALRERRRPIDRLPITGSTISENFAGCAVARKMPLGCAL